MKNTRLILVSLLIVFFSLTSFLKLPAGTIKGTVNPANGGLRAVAVSNTDTSRSVINEGVFVITNVKQGNYILIIEAKPPYKNAIRDAVIVTEYGTTDVGEIKLSQ
ncbi:MAG: carboxypeptidase regulatory-like domain-containing protein [Bacteroidota bacterium]